MPNVTRLFQVVLRDGARPISLRLRRTFGEWLAARGLPSPDGGMPLQEFEADGLRVRMERSTYCGRYRVEESRGAGLLRTRITYHEPIPGLGGWVVVTVEEDGPAGGVRAPEFLPAYLRTARVSDGAVHLTDAPEVIDEHDIARLVHTLAERDRRVPIVVVSPDPHDASAATARAGHLATTAAGAAAVVRLADLRAQDRFNQDLGRDLRVYGGGIRTYLAPLDPATERSPHRHRAIGGGMLHTQEQDALRIVTEGAIGETTRRPLPDDVLRAYRIVSRILSGKSQPKDIHDAVTPRQPTPDAEREELRRRMMALTVRPAPASRPARASVATPAVAEGADDEPAARAEVVAHAEPDVNPAPSEPAPLGQPAGAAQAEPAWEVSDLAPRVAKVVADELRGELEAALNLAASSQGNASDGALLRQMRVLGAHVEGLREAVIDRRHGERPRERDEYDDLRDEYEILQEEYAEVVADSRKLRARIRWLEGKLAAAGQPHYGLAPDEPGFEPTSLMDAVTMARATLTHVSIGDTDSAATRLDLDYPVLARAWAGKAWDALRALNAYAKASSSGDFTGGGFREWCMCSTDHAIPAGMVVMTESQTVHTNGKYSAKRMFPVPAEVHPSGKILMEAHIKLRQGGTPAPRIHFHDDSGGPTKKIWIGHIGPHLPNTLTN
ncbi:hypothetical protein Ssi03_19800 [Sphaerisporangium siamense]|uniref:Uncharacterized protein n=1 Tax=Sphaerisporangium siamense TaxID=795645 RepID=A0A7W7DEA0_9ACTN|nr:hypothetical protein [Sphaerisporangium siamense]MBB4705182.1 hypothetical protein [Sphaerisporangium siamense]GII83990.1 hypothetical protein Ssi03_19800 [Sphaerisporangium siamense]